MGLEQTIEYHLQGSSNAYGYAVATDASGNTYVTGEQFSAVNGIDMYVLKYDSSGVLAWSRTYDVPSLDASGNTVHGNESGYGIAVDTSNNVYVVGRQLDVNGANSIGFIRKYDSAGSLVWAVPNASDPGVSGVARGVAVDAAGNTYTTGYIQNAGGDADLFLSKNDGATGVAAWAKFYTAPGTGNASGWAVVVDDTVHPGVYVTGYYQPTANNTDALTLKYDFAGTMLWQKGYDSGQTDIGKAIAVEPDANHDIDITGFQNTNGGDVFVHKYDPSTGGDSTPYPSPYDAGGSEVGRGSAPAGAERYFYTGSRSTTGGDAFLREYGYAGGGTYVSPEQSANLTNLSYNSNKTTQEIGYGIAASPAHGADTSNGTETASPLTTFYVTGYSSANGGEMFLNKYSCNAPTTGPLTFSTTNAQFDVSPSNLGIAPFTISTDASNSAGNITNYMWDWGDGTQTDSKKSPLSSHLYNPTALTTYSITLTVTDSVGQTFTVTGNVTVSPNVPPTASFTVTPSSGPAPLTVKVDGKTSSDPDSLVMCPSNPTQCASAFVKSFVWDWGDGTAPQTGGASMTHIYTNKSTTLIPPFYTITLVVTDNGGLVSVTTTQQVTVTDNYVCSPSCPTTASACGAVPPACPGATPASLASGTLSTTIGLTDSTPQTCVYAQYVSGSSLEASSTMALFSTTFGKTNASTVTLGADGHYVYYARCYDTGTATTTRDAYAPACSIAFDVGAVSAATGICYQCVSNSNCGTGYTCNKNNNTCVLGGNSLPAQCWVESIGACTNNTDCTASVEGGVCNAGTCEYARCLNTTTTACTKDTDCANGDGICNLSSNTCDYSYDCAYGPGLGTGVGGTYATSTTPQMPAMPLGVQADGQACTQPTPGAPNNCQGINGCLYYSYKSDGTPVLNSNNSVANCQDKSNGGTGCMYYSTASASAPNDYPCVNGTVCPNGSTCTNNVCADKINCLADTTSKKYPGVSNFAGIPKNCFVVDKGKGKKDYDCSAIDGCYYANDGSVDCTYGVTGGIQGNGCLYETNPAGAIFCPGASKAPTAGNSFVQCLLNPNASLPGFVTGTSSSALLPCKTSADCPANNVCLNGTCYLECQGNQDCVSGQQCVLTSIITPPPTGTIPACLGAVPPAKCVYNSNASLNATCADGQKCLPTNYCPLPLLVGTTNTAIGLSTLAAATCKYDPTYSTTLYTTTTATPFSTTGGTTHSSNVAVLPGTDTFYAQCSNASNSTLTPVCQISFGVGQPCSTSAQCAGGFSCINGICQVPYCTGALVNNAIVPVALASGTTNATMSMQTQNSSGSTNATCKYSATVPNTTQTATQQYTAMPNTFTTTGTANHSTNISPLADGSAYNEYVLCQETASGNIMPLCQIPFSVNVCSPTYSCQNGYVCTSTTGTGICVPACSGATPVTPPNLPYGTSSTNIGLTTTAQTTCKYDIAYSGSLYSASSATVFSSDAISPQTSHLTNVTGLFTGANNYYAQCQNSTNANLTSVCAISFGVGQPCSTNAQCSGGSSCINGFCQLPVCSNATPSGTLIAGTTSTVIGLTTDKNANCSYASTNTTYANMTPFATTGTTAHSTPVSGLVPGNDTQYVGCQETAVPNGIKYCQIPFGVGTASQCPPGNYYDAAYGVCCANGTMYDAASGQCTAGTFLTFCQLNPLSPLCNSGPGGPGWVGSTGITSCNTLGVTFYGTAITPAGTCDLVAIILALLQWLAWFIGLLAVLSGLRAAYLYITSVGDQKRLSLARSYLIYTTIGVGVAVLSYGIVSLTRAIMGI